MNRRLSTHACAGFALALAACANEPQRSRAIDSGPAPATTGTDPTTSGSTDDSNLPSTGTEPPSTSGAASSSTGSSSTPTNHIATVARPSGLVDDGSGVWTYEDNSVFYEVGQSFYAEYPDDYDFLVVYTEGEIPYYGAQALTVKFDVGGIGYDDIPAWVSPQDVGSAGALQQINVMNAPETYPDPSNADVLVHETAHRWAAFLQLDGLPTPDYLTGFGHWSIHVETGGPSATGYGELLDLGNGRFEFQTVWPLRLSALELYLAGLIGPGEVPPLFYVISPSGYDPPMSTLGGGPWSNSSYGEDVEFGGTRIDFTVDDLIAFNGSRTPAYPQAQTHFRFAFILVCEDPNACAPETLELVELQRQAFPQAFELATGHRATVDVTL